MVVLVLAAHLGADIAQDSGALPVPGFIWVLALLVPVVYAGMAFGLVGSLGAALSATVVLVPEELLTTHTTTQLWAGWSILVMVVVIAVLVGHRFEVQQVVARAEAKATGAEALARSEERFRLAFENNMVGMVLVDGSDRIQMANDSFCRMIGRDRHDVVGKSSAWFTHPEDTGLTLEMHRRLTAGEASRVSYTKRYVHQDGRVVFVEVSKASAGVGTGRHSYFIVSVKDVTDERTLAGKLSYQALHDPLTGLANRALFEDRLAQACEATARQGGYNAVLFIDLDDFKLVNDTFGHHVGDELLVEFAKRLSQATRKGDTLCRYGGDEFLYLATGLGSPDEAEAIARRLDTASAGPFLLNGLSISQRASIGIALSGMTGLSCDQLLRDADTALYEAKRRGKQRQVVFSPEMRQRVVTSFEVTRDIRRGLASGELTIHYQPIVNLASLVAVGFEALMRWQHPQGTWVPPSVFIPIAEQSDLIFELGSFALDRAGLDAATWGKDWGARTRPFVALNVSGRQFHDPQLLGKVESLLGSTGLEPEQLMLEITEGTALADPGWATSVVAKLTRLGVAVALDDFGTGYSSLSYLSMLRPSTIKVDRSFVSPTSEDLFSRQLLETIVSLGQKLGMTVVAEGIETYEQLARLQDLGCELGQGYLFSAAVPPEKVEALLRVPTDVATTPVGYKFVSL
jgi:diguanylate cyclase (GGDEF)-like protein/PAS domain S-box-containing protein